MGRTTGRLVLVRDEDLPSSRPSARLELLRSIAAMDVPFVRRVVAHRQVVFVNDPELISLVLVGRASSFEKSDFQRRVMGVAEGAETRLGEGLLASSNASDHAQRKLLGRVFSPAATRRHVSQVVALARELRDRWSDGATVELGDAFMRLSTRIVARALFSWELAPADERIVSDLASIGSLLGRGGEQRRDGCDDPTVIERAAAYIEARLMALVADRRRDGRPVGDAGDVIDVLLEAQAQGAKVDPTLAAHDPAHVVTDRQIRDDLLTLFITGAENPRNALTWAVHLLSRHPDVADRIRAEVHAAGADTAAGDITLETLQRLPYSLQVIKEALRLYPPGYAFGRRAVEDVRIGLLELPRNTEVVVSPYALHRRPTLYDRPDEFDPARFETQREAERHPCAYLPFGAGPRSCIGGDFALMQCHAVLAVLFGGLRFTPASDAVALPEPRVTLRPGGAVSVVVHKNPHRAEAPLA